MQATAGTAAHLSDGGGVRDHADGALDLGEVAAGHDGGRLVVDAALEAGGAPVHKLDRALGLDGGHGCVHVLGHHVSTVHQAARHVLRTRHSWDKRRSFAEALPMLSGSAMCNNCSTGSLCQNSPVQAVALSCSLHA